MPMQPNYTEALERALAAVVARAKAQADQELAAIGERATALVRDAEARVAEAQSTLAALDRRIEERLASLKDGKDADPELIGRMVAEAVGQLPAPKDGASVTIDEVRPLLQQMVAELPKPENGRDADPALIERMVREAVGQLPPPPRGEPGPEGKLAIALQWEDRVFYEGNVVIHEGATYQAVRDTGRAPPHEDWLCLARAGRDGADGRSLEIESTYDPDKTYQRLAVVALNGASFVARRDDPGPCPGDGWQLIAAQGKRGKEGAPGPKGERGPPGPAVVAIDVDNEGLLTLCNADGSTAKCDLYPLLSKLRQ